jgi:hypothetical protein
MLERPVRDKHSRLLRPFVKYGFKKFSNIGPRVSWLLEGLLEARDNHQPYPQNLVAPSNARVAVKVLPGTRALFVGSVSDEDKKFYNINFRALDLVKGTRVDLWLNSSPAKGGTFR